MAKKIKFNSEMKIITAIFAHPDAHTVFRKHGLRCVDPKYKDSIEPCVASEVETLGDGSDLHPFDLEAILSDLNNLPPLPEPGEKTPVADNKGEIASSGPSAS